MKNHNRVLTALLALVIVGLSSTEVVVAAQKGAPGKVTIYRDEYGVPHVYGNNLKATWFGVGYAMAQDRLWQADVLRRLGTGTSAELFGPGALEDDIVVRALLGGRAYRDGLFAAAKPETRKIFRAYANGVNAWIEEATAKGLLPVEYAGLGLDPPRKWRPDDSLAIAIALFQRFGEGGESEFDHHADLTELVARFGPTTGGAIFLDSHWLNDPAAVTSVPASAAAQVAVAKEVPELPELPPVDLERAATQYRRKMKILDRAFERAGVSRAPASNAIAISPKLSASGRALLLHGPQMGYTVPQINHEIGIHGGGFDVTGMSIAGAPGVAIGVARKHAWTWTTGGTDNTDLYLESVSTSDPTQYSFAGGMRSFDCRPETFAIRGGGSVTQVFCNSVHGPVLAQQPGLAITLKRAVSGYELQSFEAVYGMMRARSINKFAQAVSQSAYNFNILYADASGNIAYWHAGFIPVRAPGDSPWFPHIGAGIAEWQGFIPFSQLPQVRNPEQGWLVSWNNKPRGDWQNTTRGFNQWGPVARVSTLTNLLSAIPPGSATVQTVESLNLIAGLTTTQPSGRQQTVVVSTLLGDMLRQVDVGAAPDLAPIVGRLSSWNLLQADLDGNGVYDGPEGAIFNAWWEQFIGRVFADELGNTWEPNVVANMAGRLLGRSPLPLFHDYLDGETVSGAITGALADAVDQLTATYGSSDPAAWNQPASMQVWDPIGAVPVPDTPFMNRGTYNQITRLGRGAKMFAENVIAPGQSGDPRGPHFADQLFNYATWQYKRMRLTRNSARRNAESTLVLKREKARSR